jgi:hypothetical protein
MTVLLSLFGQLQQGIHKTMTGYGISTTTHGATNRKMAGLLPYQGVLQGNGMGPVIWLAISVLLITIMDAQGHTSIFTAAISTAILRMCCFMFVDDCDLINTATDVHTSAVSMLTRFQLALDCWEGCLRATGGGLKPSKSFWYLIDWKWNGNNWTYQTKEDSPGDLTVFDNGHRVTLRRFEPAESNVTLGIHLAMDGNQVGERNYLRQEAVDFADRYRTAPGVSANDAWEGLLTTIMATFKYPAAATQLTEQDWEFICAPVFQAGLPKAGFSRMFPRTVIFAPKLYQGLGILHPFHYQELEHLAVILYHCTHRTLTGDLIQQSWESFRLELGMPGNLTDFNYTLWGESITISWLKTVWKYCREHSIQITDTFANPTKSRVNDKFLMHSFMSHGYNSKELKVLNQVRTFL